MKHCLVVDDSRVIRKVASRILEDLEFETEEAADTQTALDACRAKMPDLILLSCIFPTGSASDLARRIRKEQGGDRPFILLCATEHDVTVITTALSSGANEYIHKPFDMDSLKTKLAECELI